MAYAYTWDAAAPVGTDLVSDGAEEIREGVKAALEERIESVVANIDTDPWAFKCIQVTSANTMAGASRMIMAYNAGIGLQYSYGADAATNGRYQLISRRSDGTNSLTFMDFSVAGALTLIAGIAAVTGSFTGLLKTTNAVQARLDLDYTGANAIKASHSTSNNLAAWTDETNIVFILQYVPSTNVLSRATGTLAVQAFQATTGVFSDNLNTTTGKKLGLNVGLTTYITENGGAPSMEFYVGSTLGFTINPGANSASLPNTARLYTHTTAFIQSTANNRIGLFANSAEKLAIDHTLTARDTALLIYDVDNAALERVTVGAADSGGAGFKLLRIAN